MKKVLSITVISIAALAGCATPEQVANTHSAELCFRVATGRFAGVSPSVFYNVLQSRGEDCSQYRGVVASRLQAEAQHDAAVSNAMGMLQAAQPRPAPVPAQRMLNCNSVPGSFGQVNTTCW